MTRDEALALLGVDADADARARKRAYLRRLKQTKPERDPEGFKRLREAYELLEAEFDSLADSGEEVAEPVQLPPNAAPEPRVNPRPSFAQLVDSAWAALEREDFNALWRIVDEALARSDAGDPHLPRQLIVHATLTAFVRGEPELARTAFTRWSTQAGSFDALRAGRAEHQVRLALTAELIGLPSTFPPEFAALIASALRQGEPDAERERMVELADERPSAAYLAHDLLMHHAPGLLALYGFSLGDGKTELLPSDGATDHPIVRVFYVVAALGFIVLLNALHCGCASAP